MKAPITLSERAAKRLKELMASADKPVIGLRVGVKARGCSGLSYTMEYATEKKPLEDAVESHGVTVLIEPTASFFLIGTEMDWVERDLGAQFVFNNPNEIDRCGCGESFRVAEKPEKTPAAT